ncbi:MAG: hypothetical protein OEW00_08345 [candidate division Zixibacteria bacterium]|nr:hypothetical protein [candidate division Zixibacteria bacterium]
MRYGGDKKRKQPQQIRETLNLLGLIFVAAAAYFLTIPSLKTEPAVRAEEAAKQRLDKKPANTEVILKEGVVTMRQFFEFSKRLERQLRRIESHLTDQSGEEIGRKN